MNIMLDKVIRAMAIALDLAEISSISNTDIVEKISNINYSDHKFSHHSKRTAYIAMKISKYLNLPKEIVDELYICSLIHDIGAVNSLLESHSNDSFIKEHCITGSNITHSFPVFKNISNIILYHHENWDGSGPMKIKGENIPLASQIIRISDLVEVLFKERIPPHKQRESILAWIKKNEGSLFSSQIAEAFSHVASADIFWFDMETISYADFILDNVSSHIDTYISLNEFLDIAYIFSSIIDSKSKFTAEHSRGISELAFRVSKYLNYPEEKCLKMKIAGLLHDIGKLAIPGDILDKNGALSDIEFSTIKSHAYYTKIILDRIEDIKDLSSWASNHHEKLNGKGYPRGLSAEDISEESRIIGVCDIYQALTEDRPYRKGLPREKAFSILDGMCSDGFICTTAVQYLKDALNTNFI